MAVLNPRPKTFRDLLISARYFVPIYQRPYSWQTDQIDQLWDDITTNEPYYFLGILLLRTTKDNDKLEVVDGQQRLSTLLMLLRAAVEVIDAEDPQAANRIQETYICVPKKISGKDTVFTLSLNKRDGEKFTSILTGTSDGEKKYPSWRYLEDGFQNLKSKLVEMKKAKGVEGLTDFIDEKVLKSEFIDILVEEDSDVYLFFETLNDRGLDLSIADLVKNKVCSVAEKNEQSTEDAAVKFDDITDKVGAGKMSSFLFHYALSRSDELITKDKLMNWYGSAVGNERNLFLKNLGAIAPIYSEFTDPNTVDKKMINRKMALRFIKSLDASRCYPLLLRGDIALSPKDFLRLCNAIEILTFRHSTISKRDAKELESKYFECTKMIRKTQNVEQVLERLKLMAMDIDDMVFQSNFEVFETKIKATGRYILWKIEEYKAKSSIPLDWDQATLEHILAKSSSWEGREEFVDKLGNFTLLSRKLNTEVSNRDFNEKKAEYKKDIKILITKELLELASFTRETIVQRQKDFATIAVEIWNPKHIV